MMAQVQSAALIAFAAILLLAAIEDLRRLTIPNALTLSALVLWPLYALAAPSLFGAVGSLACAAAVFLVGALFFSRGWLGGGDVKLLAVTTLWAGPAATPTLLVVTAVLGGVLALVLLMPPGAHFAALARAKLGPGEDPSKFGTGTPVPYGIAIAGAALIVVFVPHFR